MSINHLKDTFKSKQIENSLRLPEFPELLKKLATTIKKVAQASENEASVESCFEIELFSFIKEILGLTYYPTKEKLVNTVRHIATGHRDSNGRIDSKVGALVIEYKHWSNLNRSTKKEEASKQISEYLRGLYKGTQMDYLGVITDGIQCKFVRCENGSVWEETFEDINNKHLDRLIRTIVLLDRVALTAKNLVKDFCDPADDSIAIELVHRLFETLTNQPTEKTTMLFNEWRELFRLAHNDKSKQKAIQERSADLAKAIGKKLSTVDEEYKTLFSLQTAYAMIIKLIAYKVISKMRLHSSLISFNELAKADSKALQIQMSKLEEGAFFRDAGIENLLEGDFFSWYSSEQQWNSGIADCVHKVFSILTRYEDIALFNTGEKARDLFKDLYLKIMPDKVRHSLGEYYTPTWLADHLIQEALIAIGEKDNWKGLDPCAGSGTFVTVMIGRVLEETVTLPRKSRLKAILSRVKAMDLNPLAVLTSRINYFINISHLIDEDEKVEIPVYLGDASYVPEDSVVDGVKCLKYRIVTLRGDIDIEIPRSTVLNKLFSRTMTDIEYDIETLDADAISKRLIRITSKKDIKRTVRKKIYKLAEKLADLEKDKWNGIWPRIARNFLLTAVLERFDIIVGNPPWIDWKNLPAGYRERVKSLCISRHLFSGDARTGGINLNICALIANVSAQNWLEKKGCLAFLMPQFLIFQQTYEGFRNFMLDNNERLYFQKIIDWTKAGHPFHPVQQKFLTFILQNKIQDYSKGIDVEIFRLIKDANPRKFSADLRYTDIRNSYSTQRMIVGQCGKKSTIFTYAQNRKELNTFKAIAGKSFYIGREGIEFYPQELFLLQIAKSSSKSEHLLHLVNYQNKKKSKHKIPQMHIRIEKKYLHPLIKGININRFNITKPEFIVPFPYKKENPKIPIRLKELRKKGNSPQLAKFLLGYKSVIIAQTEYNERIIGNKEAEFYALARVGKYSFAKNYVVFRDNTKWQAAVTSEIKTSWGGLKRPLFQNHAVSICETKNGRFISLDEAHYLCAILNAPITKKYLLNSSDSRSFKIRPPIKIPEYDKKNPIHKELLKLSKKAHKSFNNKKAMAYIDKKIDQLYLEAVKKLRRS